MTSRPVSSDFIGRRAELGALTRRYEASQSALVPVYGRRRVGKTELLLRFSRGKPAVHFTAGDRLRVPQIAGFMRAAAAWLAAPHLAEQAPANWETAFRSVVAAAPKHRKLVLVLDEFQRLCRSSPEVPAVIQRLWDLEWQHGNAVMLVLCGALAGPMEHEMPGGRSSLDGRCTAGLRLEPFGFREAADFHPGWSPEEHARAWFVCGGIPAYLKRFEAGRSVVHNVTRAFFEVDGWFQREPEFLLRQDLAEVTQAASILEAIGRGHRSQSLIARAAGLTPSALAPHLKKLVARGWLERVLPLSGTPPPRTSVVYRIADPLLRFSFRFIAPNVGVLRRFAPDRTFAALVAPWWEAFCGEGFERLCREALPRIYAAEGVGGGCEVGEYWDRQVQIDVVGLRGDGRVDVGECRWGRDGTAAVADELSRRAARFPGGSRTVRRLLFLRNGRRSIPAGLIAYDLRQLYESAGP